MVLCKWWASVFFLIMRMEFPWFLWNTSV
jgi:hypothetical protein